MIEIELKNIAGLRGIHNFKIDKGLSIIHAPNGTGKSSLLKAIYLITGNKQIPEENLINYLTEKEINGYIKLRNNQMDYEVQIQRKGDTVSITYSNIDTQLFQFPSIELSFTQAKSDLYQGIIKDDTSFITSWFHKVTEDHKFELFLELSTKLLSEYKVKRDELKKKASKDISRNQVQIHSLKEEMDSLKKEITRIENSGDYQKFINKHKEKKDQIEKLKKEINSLESKRVSLTDEIFKNEDNLAKEKKELKNLNRELENFDANYPIKKEKLEKLEKKRDNLKKESQISKEKRLDNQETLTYERKQLKNYEKLLNRETCPTCYQKLDPILIKDIIGKLNLKINSLESEVKEQAKLEKNIAQQIEDIEEELTDIINFLKINRQEIEKKKQEREKNINSLTEALPGKKKKKHDITEEIENNRTILLKIQETLAEESPIQEELLKIQGDYLAKERLIRKLEDELEESSELQREYKNSELIVKKAEEVHDHYTQIVRHLKKETFEKINESLMNSFDLLELAKLKKIEFGEKNDTYTLEIVRENNVYTTLEKLSGAEKSLISLIIIWVVKQMVLPEEPFFLVDEVTTEMDDTRFKDILNYISTKTDYVIVARHKPYKGKRELITSENIISTFV